MSKIEEGGDEFVEELKQRLKKLKDALVA